MYAYTPEVVHYPCLHVKVLHSVTCKDATPRQSQLVPSEKTGENVCLNNSQYCIPEDLKANLIEKTIPCMLV